MPDSAFRSKTIRRQSRLLRLAQAAGRRADHARAAHWHARWLSTFDAATPPTEDLQHLVQAAHLTQSGDLAAAVHTMAGAAMALERRMARLSAIAQITWDELARLHAARGDQTLSEQAASRIGRCE